MNIKINCLFFLLAQTVLGSEQTLKRNQDLARLKSLYSSQVDNEIIESYFEMHSYNIHETSDALREMIDEGDEQTLKRNQDLATLKSLYSSEVDEENIANFFEMCGYDIIETSDVLQGMIDEDDVSQSKKSDENVIELMEQIDEICDKEQKKEKLKQSPELLSKDMKLVISSQLPTPKDLLKVGLVDKNWIAVDKIFDKITTNASLFENKETNEIVFETREKSLSQNEIIEQVNKWDGRFYYPNSYYQKFVEEKNWDKLFHKLIRIESMGSQELLKALAEMIDVNVRRETIALYAAIKWTCDNELLKILLKRPGTDPNLKNTNGNAVLHTAVCEYNKRVIKILLDHGARVDEINDRMKTPLMKAAEFGNEEVVKLLLAHGADPNRRDSYDKTALHYATTNNKTASVEILLKYGAEVKTRDICLKARLRKMGIPTFSTEKIPNKRKRKGK